MIVYKDPAAVLDYAFNWSTEDKPWLADGETISTRTVTVPTGLTKDSDSIVAGTVVVWLSGGTAGVTYRVECKIVTSASRTDERSMTIVCQER